MDSEEIKKIYLENRDEFYKDLIVNFEYSDRADDYQASSILSRTDWHIIKETDVEDYSIPSSIKTYRADVRTKSNEMETAIDNANDVDALQALYIYTEQDDGSVSRPLGEFPILEE